MNIQIRVAEAQARRALREVERDLARMNAAAAAASASAARVGTGGNLTAWGSQVQWAGRQLTYNFSIPIAIAGAAATKFALDNEKAMVRVNKVYGDSSLSAGTMKNELHALGGAFKELSNYFGVNQAEVIDLAGEWAAAGASGIALAKAVKLTLQTMVLGEMEAVEATKALISIQAQYGQSMDELGDTISTLNMVENETTVTMKDLIDSMSRSAGVARTAGVDVLHLAAMTASLVPATGSAATAGNGLKTIISRLLAPTKEAAEVMGLMGINTKDLGWQSLTASQRLENMSKTFMDLDDAQKTVVSTVIASRYQINRFSVLMEDMASETGRYQKTLRMAGDETANLTQMQSELNAVLTSNPQRLKQMWTILQNAMADVIQPLIVYIVALAQHIALMARKFSEMDPALQKFLIAGLAVLALIGPLGRYLGATAVLLGFFARAFTVVGGAAAGFLGFMVRIFALPFRAIGGLISGVTGILTRFAGVFLGLAGPARAASGALLGIFSSMGRVLSGLFLGFVGGWRTIFVAGFALIGRNLASIWGGSMLAIRNLTAAGLGRTFALWTIFSVNMRASAAMMFANIGRLFAVGWAAILVGARRNVLLMIPAIALAFRNLGPRIFAALRAIGPRIIGFLTGPIGLAITAITTLLVVFRKQIVDLWGQVVDSFRGQNSRIYTVFSPLVRFFGVLVDGIQSAFNRLPKGIQNAFLAVVRTVRAAVMKVYELFSWMRPEVRHSPSLIESVTNGMAEIRRQYASVGDAGAVFKKAAGDLKAFKEIAASMGQDEWSDKRSDVAATMPQGLGAFNALVGDLAVMNRLLGEQNALVSRQEAVVKRWDTSLQAANASLNSQTDVLSELQSKLQGLQDQYTGHEDAMKAFANSSIVGMGAMSDAIFDNEIAQKKLRLEILRLGDAGAGVDDLSSRLASLQGDIEALRGTSNDLRASGAGSDVLGPINGQIAQMEAAYKALEGAGGSGGGSAGSALEAQLAELQKQAEILDLENALKFDPLTRQIDKLVDGTKELTFAEIIAGVKDERAAMDNLRPSIDAATKAVANQQKAVDALTKARDAIAKTYDIEKAHLNELQDEYSFTADAIREIESALNDVASAASAARAASGGGAGSMTPGAENFIAADGANFEDVGGSGFSGRELGLDDQSDLIDKFTQDMARDAAGLFGDLDMFGPIKRMWNDFTGWWTANVTPAWKGLVDGLQEYFGGFDLSGFTSKFSEVGSFFQGVGSTIKGTWDSVVALFGPQLSEIWTKIKEGVSSVGASFKDEFSAWGKDLAPVTDVLKNLWDIIKIAGPAALAVLMSQFSVTFSVIGNIIRPVIETIGQAIRTILQIVRSVVSGAMTVFNGLVTFLKGMFNLFMGIFTFDGERIKKAWSQIWEGIKTILSGAWEAIIGTVDGLWDMIYQTFKGAAELVWGVISGFVEGIVDWFAWLYDILVGHSIVPDLVDAVWQCFIDMKDNVIKTVKEWVANVITWFTNIYNAIVQKGKDIWTAVSTKFTEIKNTITARVTETYNSVVAWFTSIWTKLKEIVLNIWTSVTGKFSEIKNTLTTRVAEIYTSVTGKFNEVKDKVGTTIDTLKTNVSNKFTNIKDAMLGAFENVRDKVSGIFNTITSYIKSGINAAIGVVNGLIKGLNKVAEILPGLSWSIAAVPLMAQGGQVPNKRVGAGFATNKARAIVGEGSNTHKEYVVPTDPRYRKRATELYRDLGTDLGLPTDYDGLGIGGFGWHSITDALGSAKDMLAEGADWVKDTARGAVSKVFQPFKNTADSLIGGINWNFGKKFAQSGLDNIWEWVLGGDEAFRGKGTEAAELQKVRSTAPGAWKKPLDTFRLSSPFGMRKNPITGVNKLHAGLDLAAPSGTAVYAAAAGIVQQLSMSGGLGNYVRMEHGAGLRTQYGHLSSMAGRPGPVPAGAMIGRVGSTGASTGPHLHFEVYQNGSPIDPFPFMAGKGASLSGAQATAPRVGINSIRLAKGGIVPAQPGGVFANIGEGRHDEVVLPLPNGWQSMFSQLGNAKMGPGAIGTLSVQRLVVTGAFDSRSTRMEPQTVNNTTNNTYHFHGDLSFPEIKNGDDAEMFIQNLGTVAGRGPRG